MYHRTYNRRYCDSRENQTDIRSTAGSCTWIIIYPSAACGYLYICLRPQSYNLLALNEIYEIYERLIFNNCYTRT